MNKKREIYVKIENLSDIILKMKEIKKKEEEIRNLFHNYDKLNLEEAKIFENWNNYIEDIFTRIDHITL